MHLQERTGMQQMQGIPLIGDRGLGPGRGGLHITPETREPGRKTGLRQDTNRQTRSGPARETRGIRETRERKDSCKMATGFRSDLQLRRESSNLGDQSKSRCKGKDQAENENISKPGKDSDPSEKTRQLRETSH